MTESKKAYGKTIFQHAIILCMILVAYSGTIRPAQARSVNGASCPNSTVSFNATSYTAGDTVTLTGSSTSGTWTLCMYDTSTGNRVAVGASGIGSISYTIATSTTLSGVIRVGGACAMNYSGTNADCRADSVIVAAQTNNGNNGGDNGENNPGGTEADRPGNSIARCDTNAWFFCNPLAGTIDSLEDAGTKSVQAILSLIGTIALFFLIYAGVTYITAAGQEEKIKNAKKIITGTIIGLGIALLAFSLLQTVLSVIQ